MITLPPYLSLLWINGHGSITVARGIIYPKCVVCNSRSLYKLIIKLWNVNHKLLTTINVFIKLEYTYYCIKNSILSATIYCQFNLLSKVDKLTNLKFSNSTIYIFTFSKKDYIYIYI